VNTTKYISFNAACFDL